MSSKTCVMIVSVPYSGGAHLSTILQTLGLNMGEMVGAEQIDVKVISINNILCESATAPRIEIRNIDIARQAIKEYVSSKAKQDNSWGINDPRLSMTFCEFAAVLEEQGIDYKIIVPMRSPHHAAIDMLARDKSLRVEKAAEILGRYIVARSLSVEKFLLEKKCDEKVLHISLNDLLDKLDETVEKLINFTGLEVTEEAKQKTLALLKPSSPVSQQ